MAYERLSHEKLKSDPTRQLREFKKEKKFLVAIDTDGCVTDNMNGKQMLIFHPQYMEFYNLWKIESYFREVAEFYNLFSRHRGCNRFIAVQLTLKALSSRKDVQKVMKENHVELPNVTVVDRFIEYARKRDLGLGNPSLERYLNEEEPTNFAVYKLLGWSEAVNRTFPHISAKIPPFRGVKKALELMAQHADVVIVSQTPYDDLADYWEKNGLTPYIRAIAGQEMGTKAQHIEMVKEAGGYKEEEVLMLGDAHGDLKAVKANNGFFYPVVPGKEEESWEAFPEAFEAFINGSYAELEKKLLGEFESYLPSTPPWEEPDYDHVVSYRKHQYIRKSLYERYNPQGKLLVL
ncbi:MAG: HAD family hydrolase [Thermotogae bacterium]|nr:HAD family hydrolase [Thermotogota bacterium]